MNIEASIMELKTFSEVMVASKCDPLASLEKQTMSKNLDLLRSFTKIREVPVKDSVKKLRERFSKTRENFVSDPQLNIT